MSHNTQLLLCTVISIGLLVALIVRWKLNSILALVLASLFVGLITGLKPSQIGSAFQEGMGSVLGSIAMVIGLGTILGKMLAESGGAHQVTRTLIQFFGIQRIHWAMAIIAFIIGLPVFFSVGFVLLIPIVFSLARESRVPLLLVGLPLVTGLSLVHVLVPPHPGVMAAIGVLQGDMGKTILYSLVIGLVVTLTIGPLAGKLGARMAVQPGGKLAEQFARPAEHPNPPGFYLTLLTILLPVFLILLGTAGDLAFPIDSPFRKWTNFIGHPVTALTAAVLFSFYSFGKRCGFDRNQLLKFSEECLGPIAYVLLVVGAGGGLNKVLLTAGVGDAISAQAAGLRISPLLLAWFLAAAIRVAVGSATVAITTAAGLMLPIARNTPGTNIELIVLALGGGSMMLSHVNDGGFWIIKEYFNLSLEQTFKTWSVITSLGSLLVLVLVLLLNEVL
jgi:GntP family gluconate:H+ symporter